MVYIVLISQIPFLFLIFTIRNLFNTYLLNVLKLWNCFLRDTTLDEDKTQDSLSHIHFEPHVLDFKER